MNNYCFLILVAFFCFSSNAQSYAPAAGNPGSTAIHKDSNIFVNWAATCIVNRGYMNILDQQFGYVSFGSDADGVGYSDNSNVVSLGDGGEAIMTFSSPIYDGPGADFAVFENSFDGAFLEFAFVEVSSNGIDFTRFPAVSEIQTAIQTSSFGTTDCRYVYNLAGKYELNYGVPFDLSELIGAPNLDVNSITHVRVIDVVGSVDPLFGNTDSQGVLINDPFPTAFATGGFDLDAVGVINQQPLSLIKESNDDLLVYPNPTKDRINIHSTKAGVAIIKNSLGQVIQTSPMKSAFTIDISNEPIGVYFLIIETSSNKVIKKIIKQ